MKRFLFCLFCLASAAASAQPASTTLKKVINLEVTRGEEDVLAGTKGASIVWHPVQKKYYAAMAGNINYPLAVFDAAGKALSPDSLNTMADIRGLWYNPVSKLIQGNCYSDMGWFSYKLNNKGMPVAADFFLEGEHQPGYQLAGVYDPAKQQVLFLFEGRVHFYSMKGEPQGEPLQINWGRTQKDGPDESGLFMDETPTDYNITHMIFTGIKGAELGFLNCEEERIELYNKANGYMVKTIQLPDGAVTSTSFNFAYTNGMYWLFNIELRTWTGYK